MNVSIVGMRLLLLVAALRVACCDRDESKPQRGALLSEVQLSLLAHDAQRLAILAGEELRTAVAVQQAVMQRKKEVTLEQQERSETNVEESDSTVADDGEQLYREEGEESDNSLSVGDRNSLSAEDVHQETQKDIDLGSGAVDAQLTENAGMHRKLVPTKKHRKERKVSQYHTHGKKVSAQLPHSGGVLRRNSVRPEHERERKVHSRGTSMEELYGGELKEEPERKVATEPSLHQTDTDDLEDMEDESGKGHFDDLKGRQADLNDAHAKFEEVATQAKDLAMKTYQDINAYQQSVEDLKPPVHEVSKHAHDLHQKFEGSIRSGEEERLQAWADLDAQLQNAGVNDDNS